MKNIKLISGSKEDQSADIIEKFYQNEMIPAEKKPYLTDLRQGIGTFLPTVKGSYILDASSQTATLGLGYNPSVFFGVTHFPEAWLNLKNTTDFKDFRKNYEAFLMRKLSWSSGHVFFCNSGAEANEVALGWCFEKRQHKTARKILAFEGAFHGRMIVSLGATFNASKREPYEWPSFKSVFAPWPEIKGDDSASIPAPKGWNQLWFTLDETSFQTQLSVFEKNADELQKAELAALKVVREHLKSQEIFAVILEPRQCEGGDRYASSRFHNGLVNLARAYRVPLIYDEVQNGFALGGEFFWHRIFDLKDPSGISIGPDFVTCAKKAQLGLVMSRDQITFPEQFASHSMIRGYIQGISLDQARSKIEEIEAYVRPRVASFVAEHSDDLQFPRVRGLSFSVDFKSKELLDKFIAKRYEAGLFYFPAGTHTARFRLNLGYRKQDIDLLFKNCSQVLKAAKSGAKVSEVEFPQPQNENAELWNFHLWLALHQIHALKGFYEPMSKEESLHFLQTSQMVQQQELVAQWVDKSNFKNFASQIQMLQEQCYEATRQTPQKDFDKAMSTEQGFGIVLVNSKAPEQLAGIVFLGNLSKFTDVRGVVQDPYLDDPRAMYALDLTIAPEYQGKGLGELLKAASVMAAIALGSSRIEGRNREGRAAPMININLSLGAYELQHLKNDYPDNEAHRDCFYYTKRLQWPRLKFDLNSGVECPWGLNDIRDDFVKKYMPPIVNKTCLSNYVSENYLENLKYVLDLLPPALRHAFTASGQSESVDKTIKSIWSQRKIERLISFEECFFGAGSFMSRSLSGIGEKFFPVQRLPYPTASNYKEVLAQLRVELQAKPTHSVWIEPLCQKSLLRAPNEFLEEMVKLCRELNVPSVFNDTASMFCRYDSAAFMASSLFLPDAGMVFIGGQMGISFFQKDFYISKPLEIISTWDGDEFSMAAFADAARSCQTHTEEYRELLSDFSEALQKFLAPFRPSEYSFHNGCVRFIADLPPHIAEIFGKNKNHYFAVANPDNMKRFCIGWGALK